MGEVAGRFILLADQMAGEQVRRVARGAMDISIDDINPDEWYDLNKTIISYQKAIFDHPLGGRIGLTMLGKQVFPTIKKTTNQLDDFTDPISVFKALSEFYHLNNRGDDIGDYYTENVTETSLTMRENVPHLTDFHVGMWEGIIRMFPKKYIFRDVEMLSRKEDGEPFSTYLVKYEQR